MQPCCTLARFFSDDSNRLASAGKDGQLFVWRIGEDDGPIFAQQLLSVRVAGVASAAGSGLRLAWLSTSEDLIAFSGGSTVYLASVQQAGVDGSRVGAHVALHFRIDRRRASNPNGQMSAHVYLSSLYVNLPRVERYTNPGCLHVHAPSCSESTTSMRQVEVDGDDLPDGILQVGMATAPITSLVSGAGGFLAAGTADGQVRLPACVRRRPERPLRPPPQLCIQTLGL